MRTSREVILPLGVVPDAPTGETIPAQLVEQLRHLVSDGVLAPGDALPSTRALASHLTISRGSVVTAYEQLIAEGWFESAAGRSTVVNPRLHEVHPDQAVRRSVGRPGTPRTATGRTSTAASSTRARSRAAAASELRSLRIDLRPGRPWTDSVVDAAWRASWRTAADATLSVAMPPLGWPPLRASIAEHLRRMRAVVREADQIAVTAGGREGLALLLLATGARTVGVEDPGFPSLRHVLELYGVRTVPLPVDAQGLVTDDLPEDAPDLVLVTPSHQYPLGGSLPIDRRQQLLAWADAHDVWVVEDDYDSELRYTSAPLPALTSLDAAGRVILLGTFSKTLAPAIATGFLVLPHRLVAAVTRARSALGQPVNLVTQRALAHHLDSGALGRHTQRMRHRYRRRRAQVVAKLRDLPGIRVYPMDGGLHAVVEFDRPEASVLADLAERGVAVAALSDYWAGGGSRRGLVFGFGGVSDPELDAGLDAIAEVLRR